jgi:hypothetical protein
MRLTGGVFGAGLIHQHICIASGCDAATVRTVLRVFLEKMCRFFHVLLFSAQLACAALFAASGGEQRAALLTL